MQNQNFLATGSQCKKSFFPNMIMLIQFYSKFDADSDSQKDLYFKMKGSENTHQIIIYVIHFK